MRSLCRKTKLNRGIYAGIGLFELEHPANVGERQVDTR